MPKSLSLLVGLRLARAKRSNHFISFISMVSMLGMALGVMVLILVLSVMNGFDREMRERVLGTVPHATLIKKQGIDDWRVLSARVKDLPQVVNVAPLSELQGMLTVGSKVRGVLVRGVDLTAEKEISIIEDHFLAGSLDELNGKDFGMVLGDLLAQSLKLKVGDKVTLVLPEVGMTPLGATPRLRRFTVVGIFSIGAQLDSSLALINLQAANKLLRLTSSTQGLRLQFTDVLEAPWLARSIAYFLGDDYLVRDWTASYGNLFKSIQLEKRLVALLLFMIIAVAAFNIVSTLVMVVNDKRADIAILRTMGASKGAIMRIFIIHGATTGVIGVLLGAVLGIIAALNISNFVEFLESLLQIDFLDADTYFIDYLPSHLLWSDVIAVILSALFLSFIATIYPAWRATNTRPAVALRYE